MDFRIGLDIGIASVGWAVLENDSKDEPKRIVDLGVRIFDTAEIPKTGESLAGPRREARSTRRRLRRRRHRLERIRILLEKEHIINNIEAFMEKYHTGELADVYELRMKGLDKRLTNEELAQVLIHIAKHRGFKSNRKSESVDAEGGKVLKATSENKSIMEEKGYRTIGEMIYKDEKFRTDCSWVDEHYILTPRNKQDDYRHTILRDLLVDEVHYLFEKQRELGNAYATEQLENAYVEIMCSQRSFDKGPGNQADGTPSPYGGDLIAKMVGKCTFEPGEKRAAKACYTSECFVLLQKVNNLKIYDENREMRALTPEEREEVIAMAYNVKEVKYAAVRKKLKLGEKDHFNMLVYSHGKTVAEIEKATFIKLKNFHDYKKALGSDYIDNLVVNSNTDILDEIGTILTCYKGDDGRREKLSELDLTSEQIEALLPLNPSKFQHVSIKAMKKMLPALESGERYDVACGIAGYDFKGDHGNNKSKYLKGEAINEILGEIPNPVVKRSVSQTVKVINAIIRKYGSPQAIHIELSREMAKNFTERRNLDKAMKENNQRNEKIKQELKELGVGNPTGLDIIRYRLWKDQDGICLYSGKSILIEDLFKKGIADIDHIIPYSVCFDDSYRNKVLVLASENRQKGNKTPYEYFGHNENQWYKYEQLVETRVKDYRKRQILLKKTFTKEDKEAFKERNLQDTKYITTVIYNMIRHHLEFAPYTDENKKKKVYAVNGSITSYLRKRWGLMVNEHGERVEKDRSTDTHHAKDAVVVACCTDGMIQKISRNVMGRELCMAHDVSFVDWSTGEILDANKYTREEWDEIYGVKIPLPWPHFKTELDIRFGDDPVKFLRENSKYLNLLDYPEEWLQPENQVVRPIFVSRMPNHKVNGQGHKETIRSPRIFEDEGYVISKTSLTDIKLDKDGEIADYYNPSSDMLLYNAIKERLLANGNDGKKAFAQPFYKPKSDGSQGPLVKKIKTVKRQSMGVYTNNGKGIAENGSMIRVDVFCENGKYYFVPIYTSDVTKKELPNRAATAGKPYKDWRIVKDEDFIFSLYSRDLFGFKHKRGMKGNDNNGKPVILYEEICYYIGANIATASFTGISHDRSYEFGSMGIQSLEYIKKYQVDVLGNYYEVRNEKRMKFK